MLKKRFVSMLALLLVLLVMFAALPSLAAWEAAPYADKQLNKMKNVSMSTFYSTYRNTATAVGFSVRNPGKNAIVIKDGFFLERKTGDGWQRQPEALNNHYTQKPLTNVAINGRVDFATQSAALGETLANGEYRIVADIAFAKTPNKTYPVAAYFTVADFGYAEYDKEGWVPTFYADKELNTSSTLKMTAEYPVYAPGTTEIQVVMQNTRNKVAFFDNEALIERKTATGWECYAEEDIRVPIDGGSIPARGSCAYGVWGFPVPLDPGVYRAIKVLSYDYAKEGRHLISTTFVIAEGGYDRAYMSGYTPLNKLPKSYTQEQAIADDVLFLDDNGKLLGGAKLLDFLQKAAKGYETKLRVLRYNDEGGPFYTDITHRYGMYTLEQDNTRGPGENSKLLTIEGYNNIITKKIDGKTALVITGAAAKNGEEWVILYDIAAAGASKVTKLLKPLTRNY